MLSVFLMGSIVAMVTSSSYRGNSSKVGPLQLIQVTLSEGSSLQDLGLADQDPSAKTASNIANGIALVIALYPHAVFFIRDMKFSTSSVP